MSDNLSIKDLLKKNDAGAAPIIASEEKKEKFTERMEKIQEDAFEKNAREKAVKIGLPYINLVGFPISADALALIPKTEAERLMAVCFLWSGDEARIAVVKTEAAEIKELISILRCKRFNGIFVLQSPNCEVFAENARKFMDVLRELGACPAK